MSPAGPDIILAGFPKAGTTALAQLLGQHSRIALTAPKEPNYYSWALNHPETMRSNPNILGRERYETALATAREQAPLVMDASTSYTHPGVIRKTVTQLAAGKGEIKIILATRNPLHRLLSDWKMRVREGWAPESLSKAVSLAIEGLATCLEVESPEEILEVLPSSEKWLGFIPEGEQHKKHTLISHGFYDKPTSLYREIFADDVLIVPQELLLRQPERIVARCFAHLGLEPESCRNLERQYNVGRQRSDTLLSRALKRLRLHSLARAIMPEGSFAALKKTVTTPAPEPAADLSPADWQYRFLTRLYTLMNTATQRMLEREYSLSWRFD